MTCNRCHSLLMEHRGGHLHCEVCNSMFPAKPVFTTPPAHARQRHNGGELDRSGLMRLDADHDGLTHSGKYVEAAAWGRG